MDKYINERVTLSMVCPVSSCGAKTVRALYEGLRLSGENCDCSFELIFVNNGSDDDTLRAVREIASDDHCVACVNLSRSFGVDAAAAAGCAYASGQAVAVILPGEPTDLPAKALNAWREGAEIVLHSSGKAIPLLLDRKAVRAIGVAYGRIRLDANAISSAGFKRGKIRFNRKKISSGSAMSAGDWIMGLAGACITGIGISMFFRTSHIMAAATLLAGVMCICTGAIRARLAAVAAHGPVYLVRDTFGFAEEQGPGSVSGGGDDPRQFKVLT